MKKILKKKKEIKNILRKEPEEPDPFHELDKQVKEFHGFTLTYYPDTQELLIHVDYDTTHVKTHSLIAPIAQMIHQKYINEMVSYATQEFEKKKLENT